MSRRVGRGWSLLLRRVASGWSLLSRRVGRGWSSLLVIKVPSGRGLLRWGV